MNKRIVIINGNGGVGKDFFVNLCSKYKKTKKAATIDKIKEAAKILISYNRETDEKTRKFLSDLKILTDEYNDSVIEYLLEKVKEFEKDSSEILFLFIREARDIKAIKKEINAVTLLITNKNKKFISSNIGDGGVLDYKYDYVIENTFVEKEFDKEAKKFLKGLFNEQ
jgi:hypothetical protein